MQQLASIFVFYKPFMLWSLGINMFFLSMGFSLFPIFLIKLILVLVLWYVLNETTAKRKLMFYKNLGISNFKLFFSLFVIDCLLSLPFLLLLKVFLWFLKWMTLIYLIKNGYTTLAKDLNT